MARTTRLAIIGAGTAGLTALKEAQRHTEDVVLINDGPYGTTCARVGCMPSKALLAPAHALHQGAFLAAAGVRGAEKMRAHLPSVLAHVRGLRDQFASGPARLARSLGEASIAGAPRFLDAHTLEVGGERIETEATVIATGTRPIVPPPWRELGDRVLTSDELFEQKDLGRRVAVVGLGGIGTELGQALAHLSLEVHGFTMDDTVAGLTDPRVSGAMVAALHESMQVTTGVEIGLEKDRKGIRAAAGDREVTVDWVLAAVGRRPNVEGLGLDALGVPLDDRGVPEIDPETLRVGELPVYLAGDVNGRRPLMHEASDEGRIAAWHALNPEAECLARRAPLAIVFSEPNAARVGLGYADLQDTPHVVGEADFGDQPRALMAGRNRGLIRLYADVDAGRMLGAEMAVPEGEHLAHLLAWALQQELTLDAMLQLPFYHPVVEEGLRSALQSARRELGARRATPDLPLCEEAPDWALGRS